MTGLDLPKAPTEEVLRRALCNAERLVNSRPLTEIPVDADEEGCLTPNHFILGSSNGLKPELELEHFDPKRSLAAWEELVHRFWRRWIEEYLPTLSPRAKWRKTVEPVAVGDLVYVCDKDQPSSGWMRAEIVDAVMDPESQQVREVIVTTAEGKRYRRPVSKIAMILSKQSDVANRASPGTTWEDDGGSQGESK